MGLSDIEAQYTTTMADLVLQKTWEESSFNEQETNLKGNVGYEETERERAEPGAFRGVSNAANRGGLLTSGINARRRGDTEANFGARKTANQSRLRQGLAGIKHGREGSTLKETQGEHGALDQRRKETDRWNIEHPPALPVQAAAAPAAPPSQSFQTTQTAQTGIGASGPGYHTGQEGWNRDPTNGKEYRRLPDGRFEWRGPGIKRVVA